MAQPADDDASSHVLLIGGRGGVGKSTVAAEVSSRLKRAGVRHCRIDGDWLDLAHPQADPDLFEANFRALWTNYRVRGYTRLIYSNHAAARQADRLRRLMGGQPVVTAVLLTATDGTAIARLRTREIGTDLAWHLSNLEATPAEVRDMDRITPEWVHRVSTEGRSVTDTAARVIALTGWN